MGPGVGRDSYRAFSETRLDVLLEQVERLHEVTIAVNDTVHHAPLCDGQGLRGLTTPASLSTATGESNRRLLCFRRGGMKSCESKGAHPNATSIRADARGLSRARFHPGPGG